MEDKRILDSVTWLGKTRDYELKFVMNRDGTWELTDSGLSLKRSGKFGEVNKK